jgi:hypothetical protein
LSVVVRIQCSDRLDFHQHVPDQIILIRAQPHVRSGVPATPTEITNRLNEIACQNVLEAELAALPAGVTLTSFDADDALAHLPISSKFNGEAAFLTMLFEAGRNAVGIVRRTGRA